MAGLPEDDHKDDEMADYDPLSPWSAFKPPREPRSIPCQPVDPNRGKPKGKIDYFDIYEKTK